MLPNVVIVTVDCLRRDRLSAYGHERLTTPFLDSLTERAMHATSAHSVSSWTCPAVVSLHTGLYPHRHGGGVVPGEPKNLSKHNLPTLLPAEVPTLPEILRKKGYSTAAMIAVWNAHLPMPGRFDRVEMIEKPAPKLVRRAMKWIRQQVGPYLLWLHLGDCHEPLDVPRSLRGTFGTIPDVKRSLTWDFTKATDLVGTPEFERYRDARIRLYDVSVRAVDATLRDLWASLAETGQRDRTLFVVTSDHGEEFWEHRDEEMSGFTDPRGIYGTGHGHNLFQVHLLIPLLVAGPGVPVGPVEANVSLVDVAPTILAAAGVDGPDMDGKPLFEASPDRPVLAGSVAYGHEKASVVLGDSKLLTSPLDGYEQVLELGPNRREIGASGDPTLAERLRRFLPGASAMGEQVEATDEIVSHLKTLGYIE